MPDANKRYRSILPQRESTRLADVQGPGGADDTLVSPPGHHRSAPLPSAAQPTPGSTSSSGGETTSAKKRKRVGVQIACNACRQRKARVSFQASCWHRVRRSPKQIHFLPGGKLHTRGLEPPSLPWSDFIKLYLFPWYTARGTERCLISK